MLLLKYIFDWYTVGLSDCSLNPRVIKYFYARIPRIRKIQQQMEKSDKQIEINYLIELSSLVATSSNELAHYYMREATLRAHKYDKALPVEFQKWTCKYCCNVLIPSHNCDAIIKKHEYEVKMKGSSTNGGNIISSLQQQHSNVKTKYHNQIVRHCTSCGKSNIQDGLVKKRKVIMSKEKRAVHTEVSKKGKKGDKHSLASLVSSEMKSSPIPPLPSPSSLFSLGNNNINKNNNNNNNAAKPFTFGGGSNLNSTSSSALGVKAKAPTLLEMKEMSKKRKRNKESEKVVQQPEAKKPGSNLSSMFNSLSGK